MRYPCPPSSSGLPKVTRLSTSRVRKITLADTTLKNVLSLLAFS